MVARISPEMQEKLLKLLLAVSEGRSEEAASQAMEIGKKQERFDAKEFRRQTADLIGLYQHATVGEIQVGKVILELSRVSGETGLILPPS